MYFLDRADETRTPHFELRTAVDKNALTLPVMPVRLNHRSAVEEGTEACGQSETLISGQSDLWPSPTQNKWTTEKQSMNQHWFTRFHKTLRPKEIDLVCPLLNQHLSPKTHPKQKTLKHNQIQAANNMIYMSIYWRRADRYFGWVPAHHASNSARLGKCHMVGDQHLSNH